MRIFTSVPPRRDGTVIAEVNGNRYIFAGTGGCSVLSCDVAYDDVPALLRTDNFHGAMLTFEDDRLEETGTSGLDLDDDEGDENGPLIEEPASAVSIQAKPTSAVMRGRPRKS